MKLIRVVSRTFVAGCIAHDGRIVRAAPILRRHLMGLDGKAFVACCKARGWAWQVVEVF